MRTLFSLIKKLTKSEKRRFKLYSLKKIGENKYAILFECIEILCSEDEKFCEKKLMALLYTKDFFIQEQTEQEKISYLNAMQYYLRNQILKTLRTLSETEKKPSFLININLLNAELASRKDLDELKEKEIKKAIKLAEKFDLTDELFRIKRLEIGMSHYDFNKDTPKKVDELHEDMLELLEKKKIETEYSRLNYKLYYAYSEGFRYSKNSKELKAFNKEVSALDLTIAAKNFHTHYVYYKIKAFFSLLTNQLEHAFNCLLKALELWENHPDFILKYPMRYQTVLINYLNICIVSGKYDENYNSLLKKMKKLKIDYRKDYVYNQAMIMQIEQLRILNIGTLDESVRFIRRIDKFLETYENEITDTKLFNFQYNIMILYFMMEDYENALIRSKKLLEFNNKKVRKDLKAKTLVLSLIFMYEQNIKKELINILTDEELDKQWDALASAKGKLARQKQYNAFHKLIEQHLIYISNTYDAPKLEIAFYKMRSALFELREKIGEANIGGLGIHEALYWVEHKITGKSIRDIINEERNSDDEDC